LINQDSGLGYPDGRNPGGAKIKMGNRLADSDNENILTEDEG